MKRGFTLVELLAVIVVLSVVSLIAVSTIGNVIENSKRIAFEDTGYGIISAADVYYAQHIADISSDLTFNCNSNGCETSSGEKLSFKGKINGSGSIVLFKQGKTALCLNDGKYTIIKNSNESKISSNEGKGCLYNDEDLIFTNMKDTYDAKDIAYTHDSYPGIHTVEDALDTLYPLLSSD